MKALVTGATGFLGSHLVDRLLQKGWEVSALVRRTSDLKWLKGKKIDYCYGEIVGDLGGLEGSLRGVDVCFHIAGIIDALRWKDFQRVNVAGTANLLETACRVNRSMKKIVVVTSLAAHGPSQNGSTATEESACQPVTDYGRSKRDAEIVVQRYADRLPISVIRPPAIYGPRDMRTQDFFRIAQRGFFPIPLLKDSRLNLVHVRDVVSGIVLAAESPVTGTFFIGDRQHYSWEEVVGVMSEVLGRRIRIVWVPISLLKVAGVTLSLLSKMTGRHFPLGSSNMKNFIQPQWTLSIEKAERLLQYRPQFSLREGFRETMRWYQDRGWL